MHDFAELVKISQQRTRVLLGAAKLGPAEEKLKPTL
jgi:hypothetical protein